MEARRHRSRRYPQDLGGLAVVEPLAIDEHDRDSLIDRQLRQCPADSLRRADDAVRSGTIDRIDRVDQRSGARLRLRSSSMHAL